MIGVSETVQLAALRSVVFGAIDDWNAAHPHPLSSRHERGSINVSVTFVDARGSASYAIKVTCSLSGSAHLTFHGPDLAAVAEIARLTLEHRIAVELQQRAAKAADDEFTRRYRVAV
jgi:hypothetical protein